MALSLSQNGVTISPPSTTLTSYSGAGDNGKTLVMSNGSIRITFVWGVHNTTTYRWWFDLIEYNDNGTWLVALYGRDSPMIVNGSNGQAKATNAALSVLVNDGTTLTVQMQASQTSGGTPFTQTYPFTLYADTTKAPVIGFKGYLAASSAVTGLTANNYVEDYGPAAFSTGASGSCLAFFQGVLGPYNGTTSDNVLLVGTLGNARGSSPLIRKGTNANQRGYVGGYSLYLANGLQVTAIISPTSYQNLINNVHDSTDSTKQWGSPQLYYNHWSFNNNFRTVDLAYQSQHDNQNTYFRLATAFGSSASTTNFPQAASTTDSATTLNLEWCLIIEKPAASGGTTPRMAIPRWRLPYAINYWTDFLYARPSVGGSGISGGGSGPMWQSLATLESTVQNELHTSSSYWTTNYGYQLFATDNTQYESYATALGLRTALRYLNLGVGTNDAQTFADACALALANYQAQSGVPLGSFNKVYNTGTTHYSGSSQHFGCQDNSSNHVTDANQPHVPLYVQAECMWALYQYYRVRGNQTLAATYGNITVATLLDQSCTYLAATVNGDGGWYTENTKLGSYMASDPNVGAQNSASPTPDLAAVILAWCQYSTNSSVTSWQKVATKAIAYWMDSKTVPNGGYEFGENHIDYSAHGIECCLRAFSWLYKQYGATRYLEQFVYYMEIAFLLCKRVDEVINNSQTQSKDLHTGALMGTISWGGVITGEAGNIWHWLLTEGLQLHPGLQGYHYYYLWAALAHMTWSYRDSATYTSSFAMANAFLSPNTTFAASGGVDNTRHGKHIGGAALHLLPTQTLCSSSNNQVLSSCLEGNLSHTTPVGRTIIVTNPQTSQQTTTLTVKGQAGKSVTQDGTPITGTTSGSDMTVALTLSAGQVTQLVVR